MIVADRPIPLAVSKRPSSHFRSDSRPSGRVNSQLPCSEAIPVYPPRRELLLAQSAPCEGPREHQNSSFNYLQNQQLQKCIKTKDFNL